MRPLAPTWTSLAASSSRWTRWMRTSAEPPAAAQRLVVLADLVALGQVGIEVVLAVEDRARRELAAEREADHQPRSGSAPRVDDRQRPGQAEADRAGVRVRRLAEGQLAAAEHLRARASWTWISSPMTGSNVGHRALPRHARRSRSPARARAPRRAVAVLAERRARELEADGSPSLRPAGDRDRRDPGQRHRHGAEVVEVHRERVVGLRAELEGDRRARSA